MGCVCSQSEKKMKNLSSRKSIANTNSRSLIIMNNQNQGIVIQENNGEPFLQSANIPDFNMPEYEGSVYVGQGIKRMKAYKSYLNLGEIKKKRDEFWGTRTEGNQEFWQILKFICSSNDLDEEMRQILIREYSIKPYKECINIVYDSKGFIYEIPNYCINEPYNYELTQNKNDESLNKIMLKNNSTGNHTNRIVDSYNFISNRTQQEKLLNVIIKQDHEKIYIEINVDESVQKLKNEIILSNFDKYNDLNKIRLFYGGREMKNNMKLRNFSLMNNCVLQMLYRKLG